MISILSLAVATTAAAVAAAPSAFTASSTPTAWSAPKAMAAQVAPEESDYYRVDRLVPPEGSVLEVGGMDWLPDVTGRKGGARLALSTRRGQVWIVENPFADDPAEARFTLFAEGLQEGLGLAVVDGKIHVLQRGELSRLSDDDGDGRCDRIETLCDGWGLSGHYHEFAYGLPRDAQGGFFLSLNVSFGDPQWWHGRSTAPWRGWVLRVSREGVLEPYASGFRSPCGLGLSEAGELFVTDNQGDWMPACPVFHVKPGRFYGHPASLGWTKEYLATKTTPSDTIPPEREREAPALWLPYKWSRSAGNLAPDTTEGRFGPFAHQLFVAELTNGLVLRAALEKVRGEYQGACFMFRRRVGSAVRVLFAPPEKGAQRRQTDPSGGMLFAGLTNRGWGGLAPAHGVARIRWLGKTPLEMKSVHLLQDGFEIEFTKPLAPGLSVSPANVALTQYRYDWWWEYGSPERETRALEVTSVETAADRRSVVMRAKDLRAGEMARCVLSGIVAEDGDPLLHDEFAYTLNQLPEGPANTAPIARLVPPPPAREREAEGWLRLCYTDAFDQWQSSGWSLVEAEVDAEDAAKLVTREGNGALVNDGRVAGAAAGSEVAGGETAAPPSDFVSKPVFGDAKLHAEFMLPQGGGGGVMLMGRYEIRLSSDASCGAIAPGPGFPGREPALECFKGPGQWHDLDLVFRAPRFDAGGKKVQDARFEKILVDDILLHEGIDLPGPTEGGYTDGAEGEVARGPLRFRGDRGKVALGGIQIRPLDEPEKHEGFVPLFDGEGLEGWMEMGAASWKVEDGVLVGSGGKGYLASERSDFRDFELAARMKISDGGNSGILFRAASESAGLAGYEADVNSSHPDEQHTGSLRGLAPVKVHLVGSDTWFDYGVRCREEDGGTRVTISVNGIVITDTLDRERRFGPGRIAIEQHHEGSVVEVKALAIREL